MTSRPRLPLDQPFVLIDNARGGSATLLRGPVDVITAHAPGDVPAALERLRDLGGRHAAGFLSYEAGHALDPKLAPLARPADADGVPLLWFGLFDRAERVDAAELLPDAAGAWCGPPRPLIDRADYDAALARLHEHILDGDIYQANFTFQAEVKFAGHPLALYAALRERAKAGYGAVVFTGTHWILSLSPELFFTLDQGELRARPMKGTAQRGASLDEDQAAIEELASDPKQRAENLMIVDLLRNDLSRVAQPGSVAVPRLFTVETYPTVHQMVSSVTARIEPGRDAVDSIRALFPCGSITGAPKLRAMEIIDSLEAGPRGVYCGSIGRIRPDGGAAFNVAIRTLTVRDGEDVARLGLGSGIVADSRAGSEWRECLAKGAFVAAPGRFDLVETMRHDSHEGVVDLDRHLGRMKASADALGFDFDRHGARNELQAAGFGAGNAKMRLLLARSGAMAVEVEPLGEPPVEPVPVAVRPLPVPAQDFRLRHKTSDREFYRAALAAAGTYEVAFIDPDGFLTEGSFTTIFVERDGGLLTPPLSLGLLPGVLRQRLIDEGRATEAPLRERDLEGGFLIGNSVRGLIRARLA
ncbi:aminodeoxychorismate synthase component I [Sphingosinicella sp. YJ22]|uniref:aminodeoxychorismate synthase component I n=1 Tax=Sphingosinicella sp. YJ22 TaxID=1104780 RepID=UPI001FAFA88D|nr:aminodeoxychorismate synthase component I [Sphingosinicella sp. YJ22]